ncbi:hypothetical protein [Vibrio owensii]|uniref:hypothetical protein n=1 Tax=Vibrio owensii TaxID=696485 RepID=UPI0018F1E78F|nr:hypothetical protein [Vibrio owensii]
MEWTDNAAFLNMTSHETAKLVAIPLLMKLGLSLETAINARHRAKCAIWEYACEEFTNYYSERPRKRTDPYRLFERLEQKGFYDSSFDFEGYTLINPWDFV